MTVAQDKAMIATLGRVRAQVTKAMDPTPAPARNSIISGATGKQIQK
jgi:hypothetical protein